MSSRSLMASRSLTCCRAPVLALFDHVVRSLASALRSFLGSVSEHVFQTFCGGDVVLAGVVLLAPAAGVPDLDTEVDADDHDVAAESGELAQVLRDGDPALTVGGDGLRPREERARGAALPLPPPRLLQHR